MCSQSRGLLPSASIAVWLPNTGTKFPADAEAHAHAEGNDQEADQHLGYYPVALAEFGKALTRVLVDLGGLGLLLPVSLTRPNLAICTALEVAVARALHAAGIVATSQSSTRNHSLQISIKGVEFIVGGGWGRDGRGAIEPCNGAGRRNC